MRALLTGCCLAATASSALAENSWDASVIDVRLVSETNAVVPGEPFTVGLLMRLVDGWHTYWKAPGDVGVPTRLEWQLPAGWSAGPIQWQVPDRVKMASITAYGFRGEVLHLVEIRPPDNLSASSVTLRTQASWMMCGRTCKPSFGRFEISLPVAAKSRTDSRWRETFARARSNLPVALPDWEFAASRTAGHSAGRSAGRSASRSAGRTDGEIRLRITLPASFKPGAGEPYFFSGDGQVESDKPQTVIRKGNTLELRLKPAPFGPKNPQALIGLLAVDKSWFPGRDVRAIKVFATY